VTINSADDLINMLKKIKAAVPADVSPLALPNQGDDPYRVWWATYFQMGGTPIVSDDGTSVTLDKDTAVKAADFVNSLYTDGYILPGITDHQAQFQSGKAATVIAGTWATGAFEQTDGLNFAPQIFPTLFNNSKDAWADGHTLTIPVKKNRSDADTQAAVDFINWVSTTGALTWAGSGQIPSNTTVTTSQDYLNMPYRPDYMQEKEDVVLPPSNPNFASLKQTMIDNLNTIWTGQSSSSDAISNMYDEMGSDLQ
jgi:multiple sugar transport system substrate-binding protein